MGTGLGLAAPMAPHPSMELSPLLTAAPVSVGTGSPTPQATERHRAGCSRQPRHRATQPPHRPAHPRSGVTVVDEAGLEGRTTRALGGRLGSTPPASTATVRTPRSASHVTVSRFGQPIMASDYPRPLRPMATQHWPGCGSIRAWMSRSPSPPISPSVSARFMLQTTWRWSETRA